MSSLLRRQFKVCLIGDGYVGKTSIRRSYLGSVFKRSYIATLGVDFAQKTIIHEKIPVYLVIWDIAGQPLFQGLRKRYYEGCSGLILVYSVVDRNAFDNASKWLVEAHGFMGRLPPLVVVGNKIDLRESHPQEETVTFEEGLAFTRRFSERLNAPAIFIETSALTGENIDDAFRSLTEMMIDEANQATHGRIKVRSSRVLEEPVAVVKSETAMSRQANEVSPQVPHAPAESVTTPPSIQEERTSELSSKLVNLRAELTSAEAELSNVTSSFDTALLNLRNTVHVKRMMYEHLKRQIQDTRQEWSEAYDEYVKTNQRKKDELEKRSKQIEDIRRRIKMLEDGR